MGAYTPVSIGSADLLRMVSSDVIEPTLATLDSMGARYRGFLYAGLMISSDGAPSVVEFNCRMGDPEAQVVLPAINEDLLGPMWSIASGDWSPGQAVIEAARAAVTTVLAAPGYPEAPRKGAAIQLPAAIEDDALLFHAGTKIEGGALRVSGGRVLCATGFGEDVAAAAAASRRLADAVEFEGKVFRRDIAWREVARARAT
jgi:phosphoribosylamine--glycine ligase